MDEALREVNELLLQAATSEQRELFETSALDEYLRDTDARRARRRPRSATAPTATLEPFIPRRGDGLMLSASDIETYRICPLKYKFARVFRIPQEPTINQRFGIVMHQVLERFHTGGERVARAPDGAVRGLVAPQRVRRLERRPAVPRAGGRRRCERYWELDRERDAEPVWVERSFSFKLGPHLLRGRVDRVDRLPDGALRADRLQDRQGRRPSEDLREDIQLSIYQMGARESWELETSAQSYYYVLDNEKVPVEHSEEELERVRGTVAETASGSSTTSSSRSRRRRSARSATTGSSARRLRSKLHAARLLGAALAQVALEVARDRVG